MYNIRLYPLACDQRCVFNMLIAHIPSIFKFHAFGKFHIDAGLRVKDLLSTPRLPIGLRNKPQQKEDGQFYAPILALIVS